MLYSFAVEVARYRDPTKYSMMMEFDNSPITEYFAIKVSHEITIVILCHYIMICVTRLI